MILSVYFKSNSFLNHKGRIAKDFNDIKNGGAFGPPPPPPHLAKKLNNFKARLNSMNQWSANVDWLNEMKLFVFKEKRCLLFIFTNLKEIYIYIKISLGFRDENTFLFHHFITIIIKL